MKLRLPRFRHLRTKLTVLYAGLFSAAMLCASLILFAIVERNATQQVRGELVASGTVFDRLWAQRTAQLGGAAALLARDYGFRAAVGTGDKQTIESALVNLRQRLGVPIAFVVGANDSVVGLKTSKEIQEAARFWRALDAGQMTGVVRLGGAARHVIAAPIMAPDLVGWVVFGTNLDAREMESLQRLSAIPIEASVYQRSGAGGKWVDADDQQPSEPAVAQTIDSRKGAKTPSEVGTGQGTAIALVKPLPVLEGSPESVLVLRYPLEGALASYRQLQLAIALTGLLGLLVTVLATWRMARSITRPVTLLDAAAERLANGAEASVPVEDSDELGRLAATFNRMAAGIAERERRITHLAFNDVLTGLPNRALFQEHLELELQARGRNGGTIALLCVDLDDFKSINDTLGHPIGDELLRQIAEALRAAMPRCFIARLGGDEFVIVADPDDADSVERIAQRALEAIELPVVIDGHSLAPGGSIGIALAPADGDDARALLKNADLALYRAKELGRRTYCFFEESLNDRAQERRRVENDLRMALKEGQFELHFQPLFDLAKNRIGSFEALLRWNHPTRGQVSPLDFIPIAEETGLIVEIGAWAMREACAHAQTWPDHVRVAVNVSSVQFRRPGLADVVLQSLMMSGLRPNRLELEITESIFLEGSDATLKMLHSLRALGVRIALDDFGTGYSSLSYLQSFPFDKIKIDRSFIQDLLTRPGAGAIVRAITDLARALGMETTAEGVEESDQLTELRQHGCSSVQGYLFSRPIESRAVAALLAGEDGVLEQRRAIG
ncbi:EAL domain-containing protein [Sphingomonas sp. JC676]|uniref:bifunctional diguanylate cyclase/phosphodiesterase n=1 Tax=Sphingomonas sp. JC676 TaxID=2768065 RepID=UPI0016579723|nr:EAL domain-containing protein [Sphingomonas sp. JC676]MBC9032245.1 EAL domain-containing protein [Sphingomonas sp. JC676]